jgi:hypothetical protein
VQEVCASFPSIGLDTERLSRALCIFSPLFLFFLFCTCRANLLQLFGDQKEIGDSSSNLMQGCIPLILSLRIIGTPSQKMTY